MKMNNKFIKGIFSGVLSLVFFFGIVSFAFAGSGSGSGGGSGGGTSQVTFMGAYLTTLTDTSSTTGATIVNSNIDEYNPTFKLVFSNNVVNSTVWNINSKAFTLSDSDGKTVPVNVSRIPDTVNSTEKANIFVSPADMLTPGKTYTLTISKTLTANNSTTLGKDTTITFTTISDTEKPTINGATDTTIKVASVDIFDPLFGVTASDNADKDLTSKITYTGTIGKKPGIYTLTYTVTDNSGNETTVMRNINVIDPVTFVGGYLTTITGNTSTTGEDITTSSKVSVNPVIKLIFTKNVVNSTVWETNRQAFSLVDADGNTVTVNVTKIPDEGVNSNTEEKRNIFLSPTEAFTPGKTYILTINGTLTANNKTTLGHNETVAFTVKMDTAPPVLTVNNGNNLVVTTNKVVVSGTTESGSVVQINDNVVTVDESGNFSYEVTLTEGLNNIKISSTDGADNTTESALAVTFNKPVPAQGDNNSDSSTSDTSSNNNSSSSSGTSTNLKSHTNSGTTGTVTATTTTASDSSATEASTAAETPATAENSTVSQTTANNTSNQQQTNKGIQKNKTTGGEVKAEKTTLYKTAKQADTKLTGDHSLINVLVIIVVIIGAAVVVFFYKKKKQTV